MTIAAFCEPRGDGQWRVDLRDCWYPRDAGTSLGVLLCTTAQKEELMRRIGDAAAAEARYERELAELRGAAIDELQHTHARAAEASRRSEFTGSLLLRATECGQEEMDAKNEARWQRDRWRLAAHRLVATLRSIFGTREDRENASDFARGMTAPVGAFPSWPPRAAPATCSAARHGRPCNGQPRPEGDGRCWWCSTEHLRGG